jgi:hypothetical protein
MVNDRRPIKALTSGLLHLVKGRFGTLRNPTAHAPKISWNMTERLDLLTMASFIYRRLDG